MTQQFFWLEKTGIIDILKPSVNNSHPYWSFSKGQLFKKLNLMQLQYLPVNTSFDK